MGDSWNNVRTVCCKPWLVLPTVYSDALSYGEQLDKFCYSLNKMIENNNILPDYVANQIKEYISSGTIREVVREMLANYILNVKYPPKGITPAVGDGSADDTEALQGCIDYASENGGVVYFPYGSYLTQPLTMKSGVSLFGFDRYSTKVVLKGGATKALLNGNASGLSVCGITLDGNSGIQVNNVNVVDMTGSNLLLNDVIIKDGYKLFDFIGDGHLQLNDIVFGNAVENCFSVDGNVIVQAKNLLFTALSKVGGVSVIDIKANGGDYEFNSVAKCDTCMMISGNDNKVVALIGGASEDYVDTGDHNNVEIIGHSQKEYYSGNVKKYANNSETTLQGTRSLHVVGESTVAIDSNSTESVDGTKSEIVTGVSSAEYKADRTIKGTNESETFTGKKVTNSEDIVMNPTNPLTYKTPQKYDNLYNYIPMKDQNNTVYKVGVLTKPNASYLMLTVDELKTLDITEGCVLCCGIESIMDCPNLLYEIKNEGIADGGSVIELNNGYFAHALFPEYVYPEWFNIKNSDTPTVKNSKWESLIAYCEKASKYIKLLPHIYEVNQTIYTSVPIASENSTSTYFNPYVTKNTNIRTNNKNVACIKAVPPFTYIHPKDVICNAVVLFDCRKNDPSFNGTNYPQNVNIHNISIDGNNISDVALCVPYYNNAEFNEIEVGGGTKNDIQFGLLWMCVFNNIVVYSDNSKRGLLWDSGFIPSNLIGTTNTINNLHFISFAIDYIPIEMNIFYTTIFNCLAFDIFNSIDCFIKTTKGTLTLNQPHFEPRENVTVGCLIDCLGTLNLTIDMLSLQFITTAKLNYLFKLLNGNVTIVNSDILNAVNGMITPLYLYTGVANLVFEMNMLGLITVPATYQTTQSGNMLIIFKSRGGYYYLSRLTSSETTAFTKLYGA